MLRNIARWSDEQVRAGRLMTPPTLPRPRSAPMPNATQTTEDRYGVANASDISMLGSPTCEACATPIHDRVRGSAPTQPMPLGTWKLTSGRVDGFTVRTSTNTGRHRPGPHPARTAAA
jgi:hypothetical protein